MKKFLFTVIGVLVLTIVVGSIWLTRINQYQVDGEMKLSFLDTPVEVIRDEHGIPYIFAENTPDLIRAQGFITAQHRLFRMELTKYLTSGRLSEILGKEKLNSDITFRTIGLEKNAKRHLEKLSPESKVFLTYYIQGINAYIENYEDEHPLELSLLSIEAKPWTELDIVKIMHLASFSHSVNYRTEIVAQKLIDALGLERAKQLMPVNINVDRRQQPRIDTKLSAGGKGLRISNTKGLIQEALIIDPNIKYIQRLGSNNWAVAPKKSASGSAMVSGDPHFDARVLPGVWHPFGLFSPEIQAIGVGGPGIPGLWMGRTSHVAFGITNAYGDVQDLYIETVDPADSSRYLEGKASYPFEIRRETIKIKDKDAPGGYRNHELVIRSTRRGPVVTGVLKGFDTPQVMTLRWAAAEAAGSELGFDKLLTCRTVAEFDEAVHLIDIVMFNWVFADRTGGIGHRASGKVPIRANGDGTVPYKIIDETDNWSGYIPKDKMPGSINPERGWVGTANHDTRPDNYNYYYSSYFSPSYRYQRLHELMSETANLSIDDNYRFMMDIRNLQSRILLPRIISVMENNEENQPEENQPILDILKAWDGTEDKTLAAPLIYHEIYWRLAHATFADDLGDKLADALLRNWYFWQERYDVLLKKTNSDWFDDQSTSSKKETLDDLILKVIGEAVSALSEQYGMDPTGWQWGQAHRIRFYSSLREKGFGSGLLGGKTVSVSGSFETLNRAGYSFGGDYDVTFFDSFRFVADLGDDEKIEAMLPGGIVGRHFTTHFNDGIESFYEGKRHSWWFNRKAVEAHAKDKVTLVP